MNSLLDFSDVEIEREYRRRSAIREDIYRKKCENDRIGFVEKVVNRIHEIDADVPIVIYDKSKGHDTWYVSYNDGVNGKSLYPFQYEFFLGRAIVRQDSRGMMDIGLYVEDIAKSFIEMYGYEKKHLNCKWFYFIKAFDFGGSVRSLSDSRPPIKSYYRIVKCKNLRKP